MGLDEAQEIYTDILYDLLCKGASKIEIVENLMSNMSVDKISDLIFDASKKAN